MSDEWRETTLGQIVDVNPESTPKWPDEHAIRYIDIASVSAEAGISLESVRSYSYGEAPGRARRRIRAGDVLVSTVRPNLRAFAVVPDDLAGEVASTGFAVLRARPGTLPGFIWSLVQSDAFVEDMVGRCTGSNYPAIRANDVAAFPVMLPPLQVQRRITDLMAHLDGHLANLRAEREALSQAVSAARAIAFLALNGRGTSTANDMFSMLLGRQKSERQSVGEHVIPYVRAANISLEGVAIDDMKAMNFSPVEQEKYCLHQGDVLLVEGGTVGLAARWTGQIRGAVGFDKHVIRLRAIPGRSTSEYALQWARWSHQSGAFDGQATGITIRALGFGRACAMPVPDIPVAEQEEITAPLAACEDHERALKVEMEQAQTLRTSLLASLLSGQAGVPPEYDSLLTEVA